MAIHLPRQRDSFGVPARYTDLKGAGLLYTPHGAWRYDSYDIEGDVATLYAQNVDLADYQYNADHGAGTVLPEGASAITAGGDWAIFTGKLYYKMPDTGAWVDTGLGSGFTSVAGLIWPGGYRDPHSGVLACQGGQLCWVNVLRPSYDVFKIDAQGTLSREWLTVNAISATSTLYPAVSPAPIYGTSVNGYALRGVYPYAGEGVFSTGSKILSPYTNVQVAGTSAQWNEHGGSPVQRCYGLILNRDTGTLYTLAGNSLSLGAGWTTLSGHALWSAIVSDAPNVYTRMYGLRDGNLYSLRKNGSTDTDWTATLIDDSGDWHMVQFIGPDEAVAIRRVNTGGPGGGAGGTGGEIDPTGNIIVSGTGTTLDGTYTLVSGTGESRLWRRDDGAGRYEIYFDSDYWYIHSSYDEVGEGEYMTHFDECRGSGSDPWTATWETSWDDYGGNQGPVPTVTQAGV